MSARMRRGRTFPAVAAGAFAGALAAAGLAIPAAASGHFDLDVEGTVEINVVGIRDRVGATDIGAPTLTSFVADVAANVDFRGSGLPAFESGLAQSAVGVQVEVPEGAATSAVSGMVAPLMSGVSVPVSTVSVSTVSASTVSAPVVVSADALWTFDAGEITVTSTITETVTEVNVGLRGHQAEINRCAGPVVSDYGTYGKVVGEHNHCGGAYVLELEVGDVVHISGYEAGRYVVAFLMDVPKKNTPVTVLSGADLFLQTCHFTGGQMRLVALAPQ